MLFKSRQPISDPTQKITKRNTKNITSRILIFCTFFLCTITSSIALDTAKKTLYLQHAQHYHNNITLSDYWVSEKLDGVRGYWDGNNLYTRQGIKLHPPTLFTAQWPNIVMEGELWSKRNDFDNISGCVRKKIADNCWLTLKLMLFDLPNSDAIFSQRIDQMKDIITHTQSPYLAMIEQKQLQTKASLYQLLDNVIREKGEGLMLHNGSAFYQRGRSNNILKLKKHYDAEAIVLAHIAGKGKYQGMMGSLKVQLMDKSGIIFNIGTGFSDEERKKPPAIGSIITFKYIGKTQRGVPRFASFLRIKR